MDVVAKVCALPVQFKARGDVSVLQLVEESGYREAARELIAEPVVRYLSGHPKLIEAWLAYSEDKRTSSGWYLVQRSDETFEIGYLPKGERISIEGRAQACAEFIIREVHAIAG